MTTNKKGSFINMGNEIRQLLGFQYPEESCMVCGRGAQETVDRIVAILKKNRIDPSKVELEMQTLTNNFGFVPGWKVDKSERGCHIYLSDFLLACYKFYDYKGVV